MRRQIRRILASFMVVVAAMLWHAKPMNAGFGNIASANAYVAQNSMKPIVPRMDLDIDLSAFIDEIHPRNNFQHVKKRTLDRSTTGSIMAFLERKQKILNAVLESEVVPRDHNRNIAFDSIPRG